MKKVKIIAVATMLLLAGTSKAVDRLEGGYIGSGGQIAQDVVWNFIKHFNYEQYYLSQDFEFTSYNNHRVDAMDFSFYCGHGNQWFITMSTGPNVDLTSAGNTADKGYGDVNCKFLTMESCDVVPCPIEKADWYTNWRHTGGIFNGIHQVCGYHTVAYFATCRQICDYYGGCIHAGLAVWQSWFDALNHESTLDERAAAVMDVNCQNDSYAAFAAHPPANDQNIMEWYQY
jgi:uncharacterized protein DUF6345